MKDPERRAWWRDRAIDACALATVFAVALVFAAWWQHVPTHHR